MSSVCISTLYVYVYVSKSMHLYVTKYMVCFDV